MKLKKSVKRFLIITMIILIALISIWIYLNVSTKKTTKKATVENEIKEYGYTLKSNKSKAYKDMFHQLQKILDSKDVDEEEYVKQISKMFILDFYSLSDKVANTDVGGVDFVHSSTQNNFLIKAEDTIYKYIQNNMYDNRTQDLPTVDEITIKNIEQKEFIVGNQTDEKAYVVEVEWTYTKDNDYQKSATLTFVHEDKKLTLVELN